jgi:hypothetical protein
VQSWPQELLCDYEESYMNTPPPIIPQTPPLVGSAALPARCFAGQAALFSVLAPFVGMGISFLASRQFSAIESAW